MAIISGIFNSDKGDRKYDAQFFAQYFASFIGNGVFPNPSTGMQVVASQNMQTAVKAGKGWINGYYVNNDSDYVLQHDVADGILKRIDRVVMRSNLLTRQIEIVIKKGTPASNPVAPTLLRNTDYHELALADVYINNGATQITQANITDQRFNTELCGIVKGTVDEIDTTNLFAQFEDAFETWFEALDVILEGNVAANLANQITQHTTQNNAHTIEQITGLRTALEYAGMYETTGIIRYYVDGTNGNDSNNGLATSTAFKTIQKAVDSVPNFRKHLVYINVLPGTYNEVVTVKNKQGIAILYIQKHESSSGTVNVWQMITSHSSLVRVSDVNFINTNNEASIEVRNSDNIIIRNCTNTTTNPAFLNATTSGVDIADCVISNKNTVIAASFSKIICDNISGSNNNTGIIAAALSEVHRTNFTAGTTSTLTGGRVTP